MSVSIKSLTDELSVLYRSTRAEISDIRDKLFELEQKKLEAEKARFDNITHADYLILEKSINHTADIIKDKKAYAQGIFDAREILLNHSQSDL